MFWFVFIAASAAAFVLAYGLVNRYISFKLHKNTYPFVLLTLFTNMFTLLSITYILPLDIFYSAQAVDPGNDESGGHENVRLVHTRSYITDAVAGTFTHENKIPNFAVFWSVIYWLEFAICWYIFPVLISYVDLKYLYPRDPSEPHRKYILQRIRGSIVCNVKFYGLCIAGIVAGLVYLKVTTNRGISDFKPLLISLSHLYSLLYMLTLLAIGLIAMPKSLLLETNDERELFVKLSQNNDELNEAKLIMTDNAERILSLPPQVNDDGMNQAINDCKIEVQSIVNTIKLHIPEFGATAANSTVTLTKTNEIYNAFMSAYYNYIYHQGRSDVIIHTLAKSQTKSSSVMGVFFRKVVGTISLLLSVTVVLLEITPAEFAHSWIFAGDSWWHFVLEMKLLIYCTLCSLYSMSKFRFQNFHLIPNGNSNPRNALYYSLYSSRLLLPLCFNFITLIPRKGHSVKSGFEKVLYKELEVIKLVNYLNLYLPVIVIVVVILGYCFDLKEKILLRILGEEYYYDFFGINYDSSAANNGVRSRSTTNGYPGDSHRSRVDEDLEYSLQDGRYLFERATSNYVMGTNNRDSRAINLE